MRKVHRFLALIAVLFGLYVGGTGTLIQVIDLRSILSHAPANDPEVQAIRDGRDGPPNFQVIRDADFDTMSLPTDFDFDRALTEVINSERAVVGDAPMSFIELRMMDAQPVGQVAVLDKLLRFDALTGAVLTDPQAAPPVRLPPAGNRASLRNTLKNIHRMTAYGNTATIVFFVLGVALFTMIMSGLFLYFQLWTARERLGRSGLVWFAGGWWRSLHRACAIGASICLVWVAFTGLLCAVGSLGVAYYRVQTNGVRPGLTVDVSSPLPEAQLPAMLRATLAAYRTANAADAIKVVRLRYFAGMPQGVIVYGETDTRQLAFNAVTGQKASLSGPDYPRTGQTFGWQGDQILKGFHRGDFIGLTGRWLSLITGFALLFLSTSGGVMYAELRRRQKPVRESATST
jgi:uncharacterized iron-regulated membrane protein